MKNLPVRRRNRVVAGRGGGGGGKLGGGGGAESTPDTLFSASTIKVVGLLSEGEVGGLVGGLKGVYRNETAVQNENGSFNFKGIKLQSRVGTPDQPYMSGFPGVETEQQIGATIRQSTPVIGTITDPDVDRVRVTLFVPALFAQKEDGSVRANTVGYFIHTRFYNGPWISQGEYQITGKNSSGYYRQHEFDLPVNRSGESAPWQIRVTRGSQDTDSFNNSQSKFTIQSDLIYYSLTAIVDTKFTYPYSALVGIKVQTGQLSDNLGEVKVLMDGVKMPVPRNRVRNEGGSYTYNGIWNGTFKEEVCDNPAWFLNLLLTNDVFGLGEFVDQAGVDKYSLYEIGRYCDQLVDDGSGKRERRYTFNGQITQQEEAFALLQLVAQIYRGMVYWSSGTVTSTQDRPTDTKILVTEANVLNGEFTYSSSSRKARHTVAIVSWHDPTNYYRETLEFVESSEGIALYGYNPTKIDLLGCTSRGQAHRAGLWALYTELYETQVLTYRASLDHVMVRPGDVISVQDPQISNLDRSGRTLDGSTANSIVLDRKVPLSPGADNSVYVTMVDGSIAEAKILSISENADDSGRTVLRVGAGLPRAPDDGAVWQITGNIVPQLFRVVTIREAEPHVYEVTALQYEPSKYAAIDTGARFVPTEFSNFPNVVEAPKELKVRPGTYFENNVPKQSLTLSWQAGNVFSTVGYYVTIIMPSGDVNSRGRTDSTSLTLLDAPPGEYTFMVRAIGITGKKSLPATVEYEFEGWDGVNAPTVANLQVKGGGATFTGRSCTLTWVNVYPPDAKPWPTKNTVRVYDLGTNEMVHEETLAARQREWTYDYEVNKNEGGPRRTFRVAVTASAVNGAEGPPTSRVFANPPPEMILPLLGGVSETIFLEFPAVADKDFAGYIYWISKTSGFAATAANVTGDTNSTFVAYPATSGTTYYVRAAAYDAFGKNPSELNVSPEQQVTATVLVFDPTDPGIPTGLTLTTASEVAVDGTVTSSVKGTWNPITAENLGRYEVAIATTETDVEPPDEDYIGGEIPAKNSWVKRGFRPGIYVWVRVRSVSRNSYGVSGWSIVRRIRAALNVEAPANPTNATVQASFERAVIKFTPSTSKDLKWVEVWALDGSSNAASPPAGATLIGTVSKNFSHYWDNLGTVATRTYWLRAVNTSDIPAASYVRAGVGTSAAVQQAQLAAGVIDATKVATGLAIPGVGATLPNPAGYGGPSLFYSTADNKLYRYVGGAWTAAVPAGDVLPGLTSGQIASLDATKLLGQVSNAQIAALDAAKILGQVTSAQIAAVEAAKLTGRITETQISDGAISTPKLLAGSVTAAQIAAGSITASKIALVDAQNLILNPDFQQGISEGWFAQVQAGTSVSLAEPVSSDLPAGCPATQAAVLTRTGAAGNCLIFHGSSSLGLDVTQGVPCNVGDWFYFDAVVYADVAGTSLARVLQRQVGTGAAGSSRLFPAQAIPAGVWTKISGRIDVTVAGRAQFYFTHNTPGPASIYITNVRFQRMNGAELVVDGSITARSIAAASIVASKLAIASSNYVYNSNMAMGASGYAAVLDVASGLTSASGAVVPSGGPDGTGAFVATGVGTLAIGKRLYVTSQQVTPTGTSVPYPVAGGATYEASAYLKGTAGTSGAVGLAWYNAAGTFLSETVGSSIVLASAPTGSMATRPRAWVIGVAPATATSVIPRASLSHTATVPSPVLGVSAPMLASANVGQGEPSDYVDSGLTTIEGSAIKTKSVTAGQIAAGTITAGEILAGTISSNLIAAGAITASKISITDPGNLFLNSVFDGQSSDGWTGLTSVELATGALAALASPTANVGYMASSATSSVAIGTGFVAVTPGEVYLIAVDAAIREGAAFQPAFLLVRTYNGSRGAALDVMAHTFTPFKPWGTYSVQWTAPAGVYFAQFGVRLAGMASPAGGVSFTNFKLRRAAGAELIVDGTITAAKIVGGAIGADQIAAGAISAEKIGVGLSTGNLLFNSDFKVDAGWSHSFSGGATGTSAFNLNRLPPGLGAVDLSVASNSPINGSGVVGYSSYRVDGTTTPDIPVTPNRRYEFFFHCSYLSNVKPSISCQWVDASGNSLGTNVTEDVIPGTLSRGSVGRLAMFLTAPPGAVAARLLGRSTYLAAGNTNTFSWWTAAYFGLALPNQETFSDWKPQANTVINGGQISTNSITARQIVAGSITTELLDAGHIDVDTIAVKGSISADKLVTGTLTADLITIGNGDLSTLFGGTNTTKISGTSISTNSITANRLKVGSRGIAVRGCEFTAVRNAAGLTGRFVWTVGRVVYQDDDGTTRGVTIDAGGYTTPNGIGYVYWNRGEGVFRGVANENEIYDPLSPDRVLMCCFSTAGGIMPVYGGTIVDGTKITTGTISAGLIGAAEIQTVHMGANTINGDRILAGTITADELAANSVTAIKIVANAVTALKINVTTLSSIVANVGTLTAGVIQSTDGSMVINLTGGTITISD